MRSIHLPRISRKRIDHRNRAVKREVLGRGADRPKLCIIRPILFALQIVKRVGMAFHGDDRTGIGGGQTQDFLEIGLIKRDGEIGAVRGEIDLEIDPCVGIKLACAAQGAHGGGGGFGVKGRDLAVVEVRQSPSVSAV